MVAGKMLSPLSLAALLLLSTAVFSVPVQDRPPIVEKLAHSDSSELKVVATIQSGGSEGVLTQKPVTGLCDDVKQYAGYFNVTTATKMYFYWFFESRGDPAKDPVVLWMTGGPGCSSGIALFNENGPCKVNADLSTSKNPYSWNTNASLLFIDQPAGTGFSYGGMGDYDSNEKEVSRDMYNFLQAFFKARPEYQANPFHTFGESYGGHYVPATAHAVFEGNKAGGGVHINLVGVGVGNGLTAPEIQYSYYAEMAYKNPVKPLVPWVVYQGMKLAAKKCTAQIQACQENEAKCEAAFTFCAISQVTPVQASGINLYDVRSKCEHPPLCYDFSPTEKYLNLPEVVEALGTTGHKWSSCNMMVNARFHTDWMQHFQTVFPSMLEAGIRVLIYAGEMDYICNYMGNKAWTLALPWKGEEEFTAAGDHAWMVEGKEAGLARSASGFTFLQVHDAGHMVPLDQPENSLAMLDSFLTDKPFY